MPLDRGKFQMVFDDKEIERARLDAQAGSARAQQEAAAKRRAISEFKRKMKEAKRAKDRHGFEQLLELQNVKRKTPDWNACWEWFYSDEI